MEEIRRALRADEVRFVLTWAMSLSSGASPGDGLRIEYRDYGRRSWKTVKTAIFPNEGEDAADVLRTLLAIRAEERKS